MFKPVVFDAEEVENQIIKLKDEKNLLLEQKLAHIQIELTQKCDENLDLKR